jgi:hypothetical protein
MHHVELERPATDPVGLDLVGPSLPGEQEAGRAGPPGSHHVGDDRGNRVEPGPLAGRAVPETRGTSPPRPSADGLDPPRGMRDLGSVPVQIGHVRLQRIELIGLRHPEGDPGPSVSPFTGGLADSGPRPATGACPHQLGRTAGSAGPGGARRPRPPGRSGGDRRRRSCRYRRGRAQRCRSGSAPHDHALRSPWPSHPG